MSKRHAIASPALCLLLLGGVAPPSSLAWPSQGSLATNVDEVIAFHEGRIDDWLDGPVNYIILAEEREIWGELTTTEERREFIDWFWIRRDDDRRDAANPFRRSFYERVVAANQRFSGFPRGWQSDRGRVWITIGQPDAMSRTTSDRLLGQLGPDFEVWTYYTSNRDLGFRAATGEVVLLFIESRPGSFRAYDPDFGEGLFPQWVERAFDYARKAAVSQDIALGEPERPAAEGRGGASLNVEVPLAEWGRLGATGSVVLPVRLPLSRLVFEEGEGDLRAEFASRLTLTPEAPAEPVVTIREWQLRLSAEEVAEHGDDGLLIAIAVAAPPGTYAALLELIQPLGGATGGWEGEIEVGVDSPPTGSSAVGTLSVSMSPTNPTVVGLLQSPEGRFTPGRPVAIHAWLRGVDLARDRLWVILTGADGSESQLQIRAARWLGSPAGPLVIDTDLPAVPPGEYRLRLVLASGANAGSVTVRIER